MHTLAHLQMHAPSHVCKHIHTHAFTYIHRRSHVYEQTLTHLHTQRQHINAHIVCCHLCLCGCVYVHVTCWCPSVFFCAWVCVFVGVCACLVCTPVYLHFACTCAGGYATQVESPTSHRPIRDSLPGSGAVDFLVVAMTTRKSANTGPSSPAWSYFAFEFES